MIANPVKTATRGAIPGRLCFLLGFINRREGRMALRRLVRCLIVILCIAISVCLEAQRSHGAATPIAAGSQHSAAFNSAGMVWTWGANYYGQLGDGTTTDRTLPAQVAGLMDVSAIAAGYYHTVVLKTDGTVWTWGWNERGQLGDGTTTNRLIPVQVPGLTGVAAIASGGHNTVALKADGTVWAWGWNESGQLGDGTTTNRLNPIQAPGCSGVSAIAAGYLHTMVLKTDGTVWAWGSNSAGQLGDGTTTNRLSPVQVPGLTNVSSISAGGYHSAVLKTDGTVRTWGYNAFGQLGDGTGTSRTSPVQVVGLDGVLAIAAYNFYTLALRADWTVRAWGRNELGQLGDGTTADRTLPVQVVGLGGECYLAGAKAVAAGGGHSVVLKMDGAIWTWGSNFSGQLGDGTKEDRLTPVNASNLKLLNRCYYLPYYRGDAEHYTSVALRNLSETNAAAVKTTLYGQDGAVLETRVLSPPLAAASQWSAVLRRDLSEEGWVLVESTEDLGGLCWVGKVAGILPWPVNMADISLIPALSTVLVVPHVAQNTDWDTTVFLCNPHNEAATITLTYIDENGLSKHTRDYLLAACGSAVCPLSELIGAGVNYGGGSVKITAPLGAAAFALYYDTETKSGSCYAGIGAVDAKH
ncbi:MAG: hypothetical protein JW884_00165 [Deltaproteobacteria bacterium]|nr:hypothetical protein [Deltaproteobacteria bacterium]